MTTPSVENPAKRGDLVIVKTIQRWPGKFAWFRVGVVTNITRDGMVKKWREVGTETLAPIDQLAGYERHWVMSQSAIRVGDAMEAAAAHTWPSGNPGMPYDSLDEVKAALRPHLINDKENPQP